jgi:hypothetical protein
VIGIRIGTLDLNLDAKFGSLDRNGVFCPLIFFRLLFFLLV